MRNLIKFKIIKRFRSTTAFLNEVDLTLQNELFGAKSYAEIPRLSRVKTILGFLPGGKYYDKGLNDYHKQVREEYGNIVVMPAMMGKPEIVFAYDVEGVIKLVRHETPLPNRHGLVVLDFFRKTIRPDIYKKEFGSVATENGEQWYKTRSVVNPVMLPPKMTNQYIPVLDEISRDFIAYLLKRRDDKNEVNLLTEVNRWSLEGMASVTLSRRLGLLNDNNNDSRAEELIKLVREMFNGFPEFETQPSIYKYYQTKAFKNFMKVNDRITEIVLSYVEETMKQNEANKDESNGGFLQKLLKINKEIAVIMSVDSLIAGIDTVSSGISAVLFSIAKNQQKQEILRNYLCELLPNKNDHFTIEKMQNMPYLRACIKESLRLQPPVSGMARETGSELVLSGHRVPKGTNVVCWPQLFYRDDKYFERPNEFLPERWLRDGGDDLTWDKQSQSYFMPFGHGVRACIGKRIANTEMECLLANLIRNYKVESEQPEYKFKSTFVNYPVGDMKLKITEL